MGNEVAMIGNRVVGIWVLLVAVLSAACAQGASFMPLPVLPPVLPWLTTDGGNAMDVSADGSTVVGSSHDGLSTRAVAWTDSGVVKQLASADNGFAVGVSANGGVIGGYWIEQSDQTAFRWTNGTGPVDIGDLPGGRRSNRVTGVSADGSVLAGFGFSAMGGEAFRWAQQGGMIGLGDLPGLDFASEAHGISADGSVIVGESVSSNGLEAFRWTSETGMVGLGDLPGGGFFSEAYDVSADGSVVVGRGLGTNPFFTTGFRWTAETGMVALPNAANGGQPLIAEGVSGDGNIIVGGLHTGNSAFAWDSFHGTRDIAELLASQGVSVDGWTLKVARAVSYDGLTIVGQGIPPDSRTHSLWVVRLDPGTFIPEPGSIALGVVAILMAVGWWQRRARMR